MKRIFALTTIVLLTLFIPNKQLNGEPDILPIITHSTQVDVDKKLHRKCLYPTIMLFDRAVGSGSGVIVRSERISNGQWCNIAVTVAHVVDGFKDGYAATVGYEDWSKIKPGSARIYPIYVCAKNNMKDIAIVMFLSSQQLPTADWGFDEKLYIGNDIIGVGCAFEDFPRVDYGKVTGIGDRFVRTSVQTIPGDSGGPIFKNYKLIALKSRIHTLPLGRQVHLAFHVALQVPVSQFQNWERREGNLSFAWDAKKRLPLLPQLMLQVQGFKDYSFVSSGLPSLNISDGLRQLFGTAEESLPSSEPSVFQTDLSAA